MARCEDFPCCGHEAGCCPDYDAATGQQLNMICVCGAKLPLNNPVSICDACLNACDEADGPDWRDKHTRKNYGNREQIASDFDDLDPDDDGYQDGFDSEYEDDQLP